MRFTAMLAIPGSRRVRQAAAGLVILRTPTAGYALTYGMGRHMLESECKDDDFGLEFAPGVWTRTASYGSET